MICRDCFLAGKGGRVICRFALDGLIARLYTLRSNNAAKCTGRTASNNATLILRILEVLQRKRHFLERGYAFSLFQPKRTKLRHIVCVCIFFCITSGLPLFKLRDERRRHPTIVGLVHKVTEIANVVCARRVNRSNVAVVTVTVKNSDDILRVFVYIYVLHKVVERVDNINSLGYLIWSHNVDCLKHKVKEDNYLKCFLYVVNNPIVAICNILFECAAFASSSAVN